MNKIFLSLAKRVEVFVQMGIVCAKNMRNKSETEENLENAKKIISYMGPVPYATWLGLMFDGRSTNLLYITKL